MGRSGWWCVAGLVLTGLLTGCGGYTTSTAPQHHPHHNGSHRRRTPRPTRTVVKSVRTVRVGRSARLRSTERVGARQRQVALRILAGKPTVSSTHLGGYGDPPENGYYVSFRISIRNQGQATVLIKPTQFQLDVGGSETAVTSYDGAAPFSGQPQQLDSAPLAPGQSVNKPLTFDVDATHGVLTFAPLGHPAIRWKF